MSGVAAPVVWAVVIVLLGAWLYHVIADHHGHLVLLKVIRPSVTVPETRHDSKWHAMSHPRRLLVNALLVAAAILIGLAWMLSPYVAAAMVTGTGVTIAILGWMHSHPQPGIRHRHRETEGSET